MFIEQISLNQWPKGLYKDIAKINLEPDEISELIDVTFEESYDDLDVFRAAIIRGKWGGCYALIRYVNCPSPGITITVMEDVKDTSSELTRILKHLDISGDKITWTASDN